MKIGGLQKFSLIDYPNKMSAIVFFSSCPFRCFYCHNPELVLSSEIKKNPLFLEKDILEFLEKRKNQLQGVVLTGGEPLIQEDLYVFVKKIKKMGYLIKLDTNGFYPERLKELIENNLIDYVAMDVKGPKEKYEQITRVKVDMQKIEKSINILKNSGIDYEFRTTVGSFLNKQDFLKIAKWLQGSKKYYLQNYIPGKTLEETNIKPYEETELAKIVKEISPYFKQCQAR